MLCPKELQKETQVYARPAGHAVDSLQFTYGIRPQERQDPPDILLRHGLQLEQAPAGPLDVHDLTVGTARALGEPRPEGFRGIQFHLTLYFCTLLSIHFHLSTQPVAVFGVHRLVSPGLRRRPGWLSPALLFSSSLRCPTLEESFPLFVDASPLDVGRLFSVIKVYIIIEMQEIIVRQRFAGFKRNKLGRFKNKLGRFRNKLGNGPGV